LVALVLYAPILISMGPGSMWNVREMTIKVWAPRVGGFAEMLRLVWQAWTRSGGWWWPALLAVGAGAFALRALRRPSPSRLAPLLMLAGATIAVRLHDVPLHSRAWMFALPTFLVCALAGVRSITRGVSAPHLRRALSCTSLCVVLAGELALAGTVGRQTYLCSEPDVQVNIREIIGECRAFGPQRCALVMRYTPAANFYRDLWELPDPPALDAEQIQRVYIVTDHLESLADLWHADLPGFDRFAEPRLHRRFSHCTIYAADRRS
jgi:hypothetical protein